MAPQKKLNPSKQYTYKEIRDFLELTQDKFSHLIGISQQQYNKIEKYKVYPRMTTFYKICQVLKSYGLSYDNVVIIKKDK